jgi:hypothetical protein
MSDERKWAHWSELGRHSLNNYDTTRNLTIYQFVIQYDKLVYDKYIQAASVDDAKSILLDQMEDEEVDLIAVSFLHVTIPSNDILHKLTRKTLD